MKDVLRMSSGGDAVGAKTVECCTSDNGFLKEELSFN